MTAANKPLTQATAEGRLSKFKENYLSTFYELEKYELDEEYADARWSLRILLEQAEEDLQYVHQQMEKIRGAREDRLERKLGGVY